MTAQLSCTEKVYRWLEGQPTGIKFRSRDAAAAIGMTHKNASSGIARLIKAKVIAHVGKLHVKDGKGVEFLYEYVSQKPVRFKRARHSLGHHGSRNVRKYADIPFLDYDPHMTNGHRLDVRPLFQPPKALSDRLLEFAIDLDLHRKKRHSAIMKKARGKKKTRIPPIATRSMIDKLTDLAIEVARLEAKHQEEYIDGSGI